MELFLNILWALMAAGVLWTWRSHWAHQQERTFGRSLREWTAVSVALILLFFAVSMTDDLHSDVVLFDECSTGRRYSLVAPHADQPSFRLAASLRGTGPAVVPAPSSIEAPSLLVLGAVIFAQSPIRSLQRNPLSSRAPPMFLSLA